MAFEEEPFRKWLTGQPLDDRTKTDQLSRARRLDRHYGDLDEAFARDGLGALLDLLVYRPTDAARHRPPPFGLTFEGDAVAGVRSLRSAARKFQAYKVATGGGQAGSDPTLFRPALPPRLALGRELAPTGFWLFQANPERYDVDAWVAAGETSLLYLVSVDDVDLIQPGDLAMLRRTASRGRPAAIVALFEVTFAPELLRNPTSASSPTQAKAARACE